MSRAAYSRQYRLTRRAYVDAKKEGPCEDCGVVYPSYVMDFDHRDPATKHRGVATAVSEGWAIARIQAEIDKCDLVCSNCHRERTHREQYDAR